MTTLTIPTHTDARGRLLAIEWHQLDYTPARVFVVTDAPVGAVRGDHTVPCRQTLVLVRGRVDVEYGPSAGSLSPVSLDRPGEAIDLRPGDYVRYRMTDADSTIVVLASEEYTGR